MSISVNGCPWYSNSTSIESRVVPGWSNAISRSSPSSALISVDLPTFGRPTTATLTRLPGADASASPSSPAPASSTNGASACSTRSRTPSPWEAEIIIGSPSPSSWNSATASGRMPSALFTASTSGPAGHAQAFADAAVLGREAIARIEHEDDDVALGDRLLGLRRHLAHDAFGIQRLEAAGVDDDVVAGAAAAFAVMTVAGQPGKVGDDRRTRPRQPIEQRRLADIGTSDQRDDRLHDSWGRPGA